MKRKLIIPLLACYLVILLSNPLSVFSQGPEPWTDENKCIKTVNGVEVATLQGFECVYKNILRILVPILGIALFLMFIIGSFQMMTAGGEPKSIEKARKTITYALFGLVAFFGAWFILKLITAITGVEVSVFKVPGS